MSVKNIKCELSDEGDRILTYIIGEESFGIIWDNKSDASVNDYLVRLCDNREMGHDKYNAGFIMGMISATFGDFQNNVIKQYKKRLKIDR